MTDKHVDEGKGRAKEAAGSLTGNDRLKAEGQGDQAKAGVKDGIDRASRALKKGLTGDKR